MSENKWVTGVLSPLLYNLLRTGFWAHLVQYIFGRWYFYVKKKSQRISQHPDPPPNQTPPVCQETKATNSTQVFRHSWPIPKSQLCTEGPLGRIRLGIFWSRHQGRIDPRGLAPYTHGGGRGPVGGWRLVYFLGFLQKIPSCWCFFRRRFEKQSRPNSPGHRIKTTLSEKREKKHLMLNETSKKPTYDVPKAGKEPSGNVKMPEFLSPLQVFGKVKGDTPKLFPVILTNLSPMFSL